MLDSTIDLIVSIVMLVGSGAVSIYLCFKSDKLIYVLLPLIVCMPISLYIGVYEGEIASMNQEKSKNLIEKTKIDSLSCYDLGLYVMNNAINSTDSDGDILNDEYKYAEAKYLVCTHTPSLEILH